MLITIAPLPCIELLLTSETGHVSKFSDVKSTKEKAKSKPKDEAAASASARPIRGRGGLDAPRGAARGRGDRGRGGFRGGRGTTHSTAPGSRAPVTSTATADSNAWGDSAATEGATTGDWATASEPVAKAAPTEPTKPTAPAEPAKKTWAQMFAKPAVPAPVPSTSRFSRVNTYGIREVALSVHQQVA